MHSTPRHILHIIIIINTAQTYPKPAYYSDFFQVLALFYSALIVICGIYINFIEIQ